MKTYFIIFIFCLSCTKQTKDSNDSLSTQVNSYNEKFLQSYLVNIDSAKIYADSIFIISKENNYTKGIGMANLNYGLLENIKGDFSLSKLNNEKALKIFTQIKNDTLIAKAIAAIGINYWQTGNYDKALEHHFKALEINEKIKSKTGTAINYNNISMVYQMQNKLPLAISFSKKALQIVNESVPNYSNISVFHNLANINGMQGKYAEALRLDSIGLQYCERLNVEFSKSMFYDNIANCNYFSGNLDEAILYHHKAITIDSTFKNDKQLGDTYHNLGEIYNDRKEYNEAITNHKRSLELSKNTGYKIGVRNATESLSNLYFKLKQVDSAYLYLRESMMIKDSIINQSTENKIAELNTLYETEKKKQKIAQQDLKISRRNILLAFFLGIFIFSVAAFYLFYNRYKLKQERKLQEELIKEEEKRSKAIIESEENERQRLARELHDGVGQLLTATKLNLSTLSHFDNDIDNNKLKNSLDILDDSIKEIRNISHNMVPDVLLKFGLQKAIENFINRINQTKKIDINFECNAFDESKLDNTAKLMLYRIIQESVNNTIKYAEATVLNLIISADETEISLMIEDDGKGFNIKNALEKDGIGLKNIQIRTDYLKGKLEIDSSSQNGTTIIIEIPLS